ncbi:G patch domain-containing protein 1 homolog [Diorhabda sublineata]|uniref:G patch domain-containing protein 1 homolog n=1 Tax=Diorhabda sublineata TaxID=1163346 RepID=UPI0024E1006D|nr:G patch domain-containing protein 1 homolog [Diorhabda sublineata]
MSDEEEENFCYYGKPLDPYDEDAFPKKKPISIEDQIATDAQGRRRFHGAFTGGFSAGFYNTVGSLEGWTPSDFKSSRQDKAKNVIQKPEDFMDTEDFEKHGIAPQTVRATKDYSTSKKRRKQVFSDGPIPGTPVLETLLTSGNETIGYLLLRKLSIKEKLQNKDEVSTNEKVYGCEIPAEFNISKKIENKYKIPDIYIESLAKPKSNTFGLDYKGLDRSHVNLFTTSNLVVTDNKNKKFSIAGQAFGVGAFEEEDDDIYMKEDMSNYDFELGKEKLNKSAHKEEGNLHFGIFKQSKVPLISKKLYPPPTIPQSFTGKHKVKKSRFEPVEIKIEENIDRTVINPAIRAGYLGEETVTPTPSQPIIKKKPTEQTIKPFDASCLMTDRFVSASTTEKSENIRETEHGTADMRNAAKMNMFGPLTRITTDWAPCAVLCKRFNVKEPLMEFSEKKKKRTKNLIFENQKYVDDELNFKPGCSVDVDEVASTSRDIEVNEDIVKTERLSPVEEKDNNLDKSINDVEESDVVPKDITEKIGIEEKVDLFKAVFLSSSESEDEDEKPDKKFEEYKETILSDLVPKIKPLKEGILSNLKFQSNDQEKQDQIKTNQEKQILFIPQKERMNPVDTEPRVQLYGPQLPTEKVVNKNINTITVIESDDEWVEKDTDEKRTKHKKSKKSKKKHKHSKKER